MFFFFFRVLGCRLVRWPLALGVRKIPEKYRQNNEKIRKMKDKSRKILKKNPNFLKKIAWGLPLGPPPRFFSKILDFFVFLSFIFPSFSYIFLIFFLYFSYNFLYFPTVLYGKKIPCVHKGPPCAQELCAEGFRPCARALCASLVRRPCAQLCACVERLCASLVRKPCVHNYLGAGRRAQVQRVVRAALHNYREQRAQPFFEMHNSK